ncbi:hypothetical protein ZWY2020_015553 [Hordeum vulgare]|nr:hypothetical protein ZWY2020_015553 [Hordeum vulgare]
MLRLGSSIPSSARPPPLPTPLSTDRISPSPSSFAVEEYLIDTCGLTRPQALKASTKLSHLKTPANLDAVLAFLGGLGLSGATAAVVVSKDPPFLYASMDKTLAPVVAGLTGLGLSHPEIACLVSLAHCGFRTRPVVSKVQYCLPSLGPLTTSTGASARMLPYLSDLGKLCIPAPRMLTTNPERVRAMVACAERLGVPHGSGMLRQALQTVGFLSEKKVTAKLEYLKNTFRWSDAEVCIAVRKFPGVLRNSEASLKRRSEFLFSKVGVEPVYIAYRPVILSLSLERRVRPRYYVVKFLKKNGLLDRDLSLCSAVKMTEKVFVDKLICPHKEAAPHLAEDYAAACKGELPTNFIFT